MVFRKQGFKLEEEVIVMDGKRKFSDSWVVGLESNQCGLE